MAESWLKMRTNLWNMPEVIRTQRVCKVSRCSVVGACFRLWSLADEYSDDGHLVGYTPEDIDAEVEIPGFAEALLDPAIGWLKPVEGRDDELQIPSFEEHNSKSAKRRAAEARRQASRRRTPDTVTNVRKTSRADAYGKRTRCVKQREQERDVDEMTSPPTPPLGGGGGGQPPPDGPDPPGPEPPDQPPDQDDETAAAWAEFNRLAPEHGIDSPVGYRRRSDAKHPDELGLAWWHRRNGTARPNPETERRRELEDRLDAHNRLRLADGRTVWAGSLEQPDGSHTPWSSFGVEQLEKLVHVVESQARLRGSSQDTKPEG